MKYCGNKDILIAKSNCKINRNVVAEKRINSLDTLRGGGQHVL